MNRPPRSRTFKMLVIGGPVAAVLLVFILILSLTIIGLNATTPKQTAAEDAAQAARSIGRVKAVLYNGSITSDSVKLSGAFKITQGGRASFTGSWGASQVQMISLDSYLFVQGDSDFWSSKAGFTPGQNTNFVDGNRWGKADPDALSFDFSVLRPQALARQLSRLTMATIGSAAFVTYNSRPAVKITYGDYTYYVATGSAPRLLRVRSTYPAYDLNVNQNGAGDAVSELATRVNLLGSSFDGTSGNSADAEIDNACTNNVPCTVHVTVTGDRGSLPGSVPVVANVWMTADGASGQQQVGTCTANGTLSGDSATMSCVVDGSDWQSWRTSFVGTKGAYQHVSVQIGGASNEEIQALLSDISGD